MNRVNIFVAESFSSFSNDLTSFDPVLIAILIIKRILTDKYFIMEKAKNPLVPPSQT